MADMIKKNWQKDAADVAINAGIRFGGAISTAFVFNKWFSGEPKDGQAKETAAKTAQTLHNISGPLFLGLGLLGDMMASDTRVKAFFQGMTTVSALQAISVIAPAAQDKIALGSCRGVNGLRGPLANIQDAKLLSGIGALNGRARVARPALGSTSVAGTTATTPTYTGDKPEELKWAEGGTTQVDTDGKTYNNDWGYLAANIDHADEITQTVNGVDEENAALMGVATPEEAALLMGMF